MALDSSFPVDVSELLTAYLKAYDERDIDAIRDHLHPDVVVIFSGAEAQRGRENILPSYKQDFENGKKVILGDPKPYIVAPGVIQAVLIAVQGDTKSTVHVRYHYNEEGVQAKHDIYDVSVETISGQMASDSSFPVDVSDFLTAYLKAYDERDIDAIRDYLHPDVVVIFSGAEAQRGRENILPSYKQDFENGKKVILGDPKPHIVAPGVIQAVLVAVQGDTKSTVHVRYHYNEEGAQVKHDIYDVSVEQIGK
eukprot:TRINITY_DN5715_c0_g1_i2.p1 TRINITY_DN5715_c0_g1~~TRINITY_DN5715_c0_g1_i2.p1  ORF type:complete len:252 (-),score=54.29 TRINITY_DN5715_c0_g1_i2:4-759(-)